jgi:hypothetical protein
MIRVTGIVFTPARLADRLLGLVGYVRCVLGGAILLDGITVRRTLGPRITLSFPRKSGGHFFHRPVDRRSRAEIERQILEVVAAQLEAAT